MRLIQQRLFHDAETKSLFGKVLDLDGRALAMSCEREWRENLRGVSAVPAGFYHLVPHDGLEYRNTFALIGATASQIPTPGMARFACVLHWASVGEDLEGCVSWGHSIRSESRRVELWGKSTGQALLSMLREEEVAHYLEIRDIAQ